MEILANFPFAGISLQFLVEDKDCPYYTLEKCLRNITIDDLEYMYINEHEAIPEIVKLLRDRGISMELVKTVF
jgi:hypothetical protein